MDKITCKEFPNREFETKEALFAELKANKQFLIDSKKAAIKFTDPIALHIKNTEQTEKAEGDSEVIGIGSTVYPVINSCWFLDSHGDVHADGIWNTSAKDQQGKIYYVINHDLEIGKVVAYPDDVELIVKTVQWREIGYDMDGETQILMYGVKLTEASNKDALSAIVSKKPIQNSVRMRYIAMLLCINDNGDDYKQEKANFDKYINRIANKQDALEQGYFWLITEAAIHKEGSAVLFGSNSVTPILYSNPSEDSSKTEIENRPASEQSREKKESNFYNLIH